MEGVTYARKYRTIWRFRLGRHSISAGAESIVAVPAGESRRAQMRTRETLCDTNENVQLTDSFGGALAPEWDPRGSATWPTREEFTASLVSETPISIQTRTPALSFFKRSHAVAAAAAVVVAGVGAVVATSGTSSADSDTPGATLVSKTDAQNAEVTFTVVVDGATRTVTSSAGTLADALAAGGWEDRVRVLELGMTWPLPTNMITEFLRGCDRVLVLEEGVDLLEQDMRALVQKQDIHVRIDNAQGRHPSGSPADTAGVYRLGAQTYAVNRPWSEDNPDQITDEKLRLLLPEASISSMQSTAETPSLVQEAWKLFLIISLACLLLEAFLCLPRHTAKRPSPTIRP